MSYKFIFDPIQKKQINIFSKKGQQIINKYVQKKRKKEKKEKKPMKKELTPIKTLKDMEKHLKKYGVFDKIKPIWNNVRRMSHKDLRNSITDGLNLAIKYNPKTKKIIEKENKKIQREFKQASPFKLKSKSPSPIPKKIIKSWFENIKNYGKYFLKWSKQMAKKNARFATTMAFASIFTILSMNSEGLLGDFYKITASNFIKAQAFHLLFSLE